MKETKYEVRYTVDNRVKSVRQVEVDEGERSFEDLAAWMLVGLGAIAIVVILL